MRVLVTGSTGFIGSHVVQQLHRAGHELVLCYREGKSNWRLFDSVARLYSSSSQVDEGDTLHDQSMLRLKSNLMEYAERLTPYEFANSELLLHGSFNKVSVDLIDFDEVLEAVKSDNFDAVVHCAAIISFHPKDREKMLRDNVEGTRNLINACVNQSVKKFMHISSIAALGRPVEDGPITLNTPWENSPYNTDYALSKYYAELEVWRGKEEGLDVKLFYPGVVLGQGDGQTSSQQVIDVVKNGNPFYPVGSNGFVFVEDLAKKVTDQLQWVDSTDRFLCVSHNLTFHKLINSIAHAYGYKSAKWPLNGLVYQIVFAVAKFCEFFRIKIPITTELMRSTSKHSVYTD